MDRIGGDVDPSINPKGTKSLTKHQIHTANVFTLIKEGILVYQVVKNLIRIPGGFEKKVIEQFTKSMEEVILLGKLKEKEIEKAIKNLKEIQLLPTKTNLDESDDDLEDRLGF